METIVKRGQLAAGIAAPVFLAYLSAALCGNIEQIYTLSSPLGFLMNFGVFKVLWTFFYVMLGVSSYLISSDGRIPQADRSSAIFLYSFVLVIIMLWNFLFFKFKLFLLGGLWAIIALAALSLCALLFSRLRPAAGQLLVASLGLMPIVIVVSFSAG